MRGWSVRQCWPRRRYDHLYPGQNGRKESDKPHDALGGLGASGRYSDYKLSYYDAYQKNLPVSGFVKLFRRHYGEYSGHSDGEKWITNTTKGREIKWRDIDHPENDFTVQLKWPEVAVRIAELIENDDYLTPNEKKEYARVVRFREERESAKTDSERCKVIADQIVEYGTQKTYSEVFSEYPHFLEDYAQFYFDHREEIKRELLAHTEVADVGDKRDRFDYDLHVSFHIRYCPRRQESLRRHLMREHRVQDFADGFIEDCASHYDTAPDGETIEWTVTPVEIGERDYLFIKDNRDEFTEYLQSKAGVKSAKFSMDRIEITFDRDYIVDIADGNILLPGEQTQRVRTVADKIIAEGIENTTEGNWVAGISNAASQRASDLKLKCEYLQELHDSDRGVVFATGTPISNSMTEMYTMQTYLQPSVLRNLGITFFDGWAADFGETITSMELTPSGQGYRARTRFAKFTNLPELLKLYRSFADVQTADMVKLNVPQAERHVVNLKPSDTVIELAEEIADRADKIYGGGVDSHIDNMLKVTSDGKKLALDPRCFVSTSEDKEGSKLNACAQNIFEIWEDTQGFQGTQIVFCDLSTPKMRFDEYEYGTDFDAYNDLKHKLVQKGIPEREIAFIHEANTDEQKQALFDKVNSGAVRVLVGSTEKCGAGTNVQKRLVALHHLDTPYRPSDMEQREGRIIRQGNTNEKVQIYTYVMERTFDSYAEHSVSGRGIHVFGRTKGADLRSFSKDGDMEYYQDRHFITMTGDRSGYSRLESFDTPEMKSLLERKLERRTEWKNVGKGEAGLSQMDDRELLEKAFSAKNGDTVRRLYHGEDLRHNHSNSDMSLMNYLAFYSGGNVEQMTRIFATSGLYRPDKPASYYEYTAIKAAKDTPHYTPPKASNSAPKAASGGNSKA
mgnify:CR=1 FL=1